jgi:hypothetical protein
VKKTAIFIAIAMGLAVAACGGSAGSAAPTSASVVKTAASSVSAAPAATPATYKIGDTITVKKDGADWAKVTLSGVKVSPSFDSGDGNLEMPTEAGLVFITAKVDYEAIAASVEASYFSWSFFNDGTAAHHAVVNYGPKPELDDVTLKATQKDSGYIVAEVPATGEVRTAFRFNDWDDNAVFEIVLRAA